MYENIRVPPPPLGVRQRLNDNFIQNESSRIHDFSRAISNKHIPIFGFNTYQEFVTVKKFRIALSRLRVSSHRLAIESGLWAKLTSKTFGGTVMLPV